MEAATRPRRRGGSAGDRGDDPAHGLGPRAGPRPQLGRRGASPVSRPPARDHSRRRVEVTIGTMIETPRAALRAGELAEVGRVLLVRHQRPDPDDLRVQPGRRRGPDDVGLPREGAAARATRSRWSTPTGSGSWSASGCERGRATRPDLKIGVCGEHGGDPASIATFYEAGLDYVSCSPFRVPVARLAAAQAVLGAEPPAPAPRTGHPAGGQEGGPLQRQGAPGRPCHGRGQDQEGDDREDQGSGDASRHR